MPVFTPPTTDGLMRGDPGRDTPADRLFSFYRPQAQGMTVWKDQLGGWHTQSYPYQDDLAAAQEYYQGGHIHTITDAKATELTAAGFGDYISQINVEQSFSTLYNTAWLNLIRDVGDGAPSHPSYTYLGGDVTDAVLTSDGVSILWIGADWFAGASVDPVDDTFNSGALPFRNGAATMVGISFQAQLHKVGNSGVWLEPDQSAYPGRHYWPIACALDGTTVRVLCWLVDSSRVANPTPYGDLEDTHIVSINAFGGQDTVIPLNINRNFWGDGLMFSGGFWYIYGEEFSPPYDMSYGFKTIEKSMTWKRVARTTSLTSPQLEFWTGSEWSKIFDHATPMVDDSGNRIIGDAGVYRHHDTDFMMAAHQLVEPYIKLYTSTSPQGPWRFRTSVNAPILGAPKNGGRTIGQLTKILAPNVAAAPPDHLQVLISRNNIDATNAFTDRHIDTYAPLFTTVPIYHAP